jgi:hypothetical protein
VRFAQDAEADAAIAGMNNVEYVVLLHAAYPSVWDYELNPKTDSMVAPFASTRHPVTAVAVEEVVVEEEVAAVDIKVS